MDDVREGKQPLAALPGPKGFYEESSAPRTMDQQLEAFEKSMERQPQLLDLLKKDMEVQLGYAREHMSYM